MGRFGKSVLVSALALSLVCMLASSNVAMGKIIGCRLGFTPVGPLQPSGRVLQARHGTLSRHNLGMQACLVGYPYALYFDGMF